MRCSNTTFASVKSRPPTFTAHSWQTRLLKVNTMTGSMLSFRRTLINFSHAPLSLLLVAMRRLPGGPPPCFCPLEALARALATLSVRISGLCPATPCPARICSSHPRPAGKEAKTTINEDESEGEEKGVKLLTLNSSPSTARKCSSGTGRLVVDTTCTGFRLVRPIHSENSLVLGVVADKNTMLTWSGSRMMTSSHTTPRSMSFT